MPLRITPLNLTVLLFFVLQSFPMYAGIVFTSGGPQNALRWDAAEQFFAGSERSLQGGLRYAMQGGSYESFRDRFAWTSVPSLSEFQHTIENSFNAWTRPDPVSGLTTSLSFAPDFSNAVVGTGTFGGINFLGSEIDLFGLDAGDNGLYGFTSVQPSGSPVTLTSGVANYAFSSGIAGVDISINSNPNAIYTLDEFGRLLTHEIGHALGFGDADLGGLFIDDNFDSSNPLATLTNSWTALVDPLDPANSPGLGLFSVGTTSLTVAGVDLLMESNGLGIGPTNPLGNLFPLTNDEYGTRQYLYPTLAAVPEVSSASLIYFLISMVGMRQRRRDTTFHAS